MSGSEAVRIESFAIGRLAGGFVVGGDADLRFGGSGEVNCDRRYQGTSKESSEDSLHI
jgi:hypothetical protein